MMRDPLFDKVKSPAHLKKDLGKVCMVDGCTNHLTQMMGPGKDLLCREHQLKLREYNGGARIDRPHTFHRTWVCAECGKDVSVEVDKKHSGLKERDPKLFNRLCRNRIIADHIIRKADGGSDAADNIQSLCLDCNADKTIINEDYKKSTKTVDTAATI